MALTLKAEKQIERMKHLVDLEALAAKASFFSFSLNRFAVIGITVEVILALEKMEAFAFQLVEV